MKSAGKTFDSEVWAKRKVVGEMLRKDTRSTAVIRVADGLDPAQVAKDMTADFSSPAIHGPDRGGLFRLAERHEPDVSVRHHRRDGVHGRWAASSAS